MQRHFWQWHYTKTIFNLKVSGTWLSFPRSVILTQNQKHCLRQSKLNLCLSPFPGIHIVESVQGVETKLKEVFKQFVLIKARVIYVFYLTAKRINLSLAHLFLDSENNVTCFQ